MKRREFLRISTYAGGGVLLSFSAAAPLGAAVHVREPGPFPSRFPVGHFLAIDAQGNVTAQIVKHEMGQGVASSFAAILAEEMGADWQRVLVRGMNHSAQYAFGTGGSNSMRSQWTPLRKAGAVARRMLCQAAATRWGARVEDCDTRDHQVLHSDGRSMGFAEIAADASRIPFTRDFTALSAEDIPLRSSDTFRLLGKRFTRKQVDDIVRGQHRYAIDVMPADALTALIVRSPTQNGRLRSFDQSSIADIAGIKTLVRMQPISREETGGAFLVRDGIAIIADSMWNALKAREQLKLEWEPGPAGFADDAAFDSDCIARIRAIESPALRETGDWTVLGDSEPLLDAEYIFPHQTHAAMEPLSACAAVDGEDVRVWIATQSPEWLIAEAGRRMGIAADRMDVHCLPSGGAFGRRFYPDVGLEAIQLAQAMKPTPVKLVWTREDDLRFGMFHFQHVARHRIWVGDDGLISAWRHDDLRNWGSELPGCFAYRVDRYRYHELNSKDQAPVPSCAWRGVTFPGWCFGIESTIDEAAHTLGVDPIEFRLRHLPEHGEAPTGNDWGISWSRLRRVLELARDRSGWNTPTPPGHARGIAVAPYADKGFCAHVVELFDDAGTVRVARVTSVVDTGFVVDPDNAEQQVVGSVIWGLTTALYGGVPIRNGVAQWSSFADNRLLRINECPRIDVHFVPAAEHPPLGLGEIPVPQVAPAVANAWFALSGQRVRRLPIPHALPVRSAAESKEIA